MKPKFKKVLVFLFISTVLFSSVGIFAQPKNHQYKTIDQLSSIENATEIEIQLNTEYVEAAKHENELNESDILGCINRWHYELYPSNHRVSTPYMLANLMDPVTAEVAAELKEIIRDCKTTEEKIQKLRDWSVANLSHTQMGPEFQGYPGNEPWGLSYFWGGPTFKKLIPSEMKAMRLHTGKISGKCMTLANFLSSVFIHLGANPDDVVLLLVVLPKARHGVAFVKYEGEILFINNYDFMPAIIAVPRNPSAVPMEGIYNHKSIKEVNFWIAPDFLDNGFLSSQKSLMQTFIDHFGLESVLPDYNQAFNFPLQDPDQLKATIFKNQDHTEYGDLAKYAYQSLYVKYPEYYLTASFRTSGARFVAEELETVQDVFDWIKSHIRFGSIFPESEERLMTADQVLVFQQGSLKDQAVLAYSILKHKGYDPVIKLTSENAYVEVDSKIFEANDWQEIKSIPEKVIFKLKMREKFPGLMEARRKGQEALRENDMKKAIEIYETLVKKYPKSSEAHEELGLIYYEADKYKLALEYLEQADKLDIPNANRYDKLSLVSLVNHNPEKAIDYLQKAIELSPGRRMLQANLIQAYVFAGQFENAKDLYLKNHNEMLNYKKFKQIINEDFQMFRDKGLDHPDVDRFIAFLEQLSPARKVTFRVIPEILPDSAQVFITGNQKDLAYWKPGVVTLEKESNGSWTKTFSFDQDTELQYKITLGSWATEAIDENGNTPPNSCLHVMNDTTVVIKVFGWKNFRSDR